jgi:hypothetical protein
MAIGKIECVVLDVKNLKEAVPFYEDLFEIKFNPLSQHVLSDGTEIKAAWCPDFGFELIEQLKPSINREGVRAFAIRVNDIARVKSDFEKRGLRPVREIYTEQPQEHEAVYNLGGYLLVITQHPDF